MTHLDLPLLTVPAADPGRFSDEPRGRWGDAGGRELCKFFASGTCRNGDQCRFSHQQGPSSGRGARYEEERYENERHRGGGMRGEDERWRCMEVNFTKQILDAEFIISATNMFAVIFAIAMIRC